MYQFFIAWDKLKLEELKARLEAVDTELCKIRSDSQRITDLVQQGNHVLDRRGNRRSDGEDLYHCDISANERLKAQLESRINLLEASIAFGQLTQSDKWVRV